LALPKPQPVAESRALLKAATQTTLVPAWSALCPCRVVQLHGWPSTLFEFAVTAQLKLTSSMAAREEVIWSRMDRLDLVGSSSGLCQLERALCPPVHPYM
jgi:hypothetical protein